MTTVMYYFESYSYSLSFSSQNASESMEWQREPSKSGYVPVTTRFMVRACFALRVGLQRRIYKSPI
jgi:hypothetical protein